MPIHDPGCKGPGFEGGCGGYVVCWGCGKRFGWCRGSDTDDGLCPTCYPDTETGIDPAVLARDKHFTPREVQVKRDPRTGRLTSRDVTP